ncbi:response regulator [Candidatus Enterococcus leclercqii]|uniref:response regulator n=1 Tax=Candidatus Enterococcus leclercqii TaxID=1857218 RepID=UPI0013797233|nr:response regulator [Enterococcus sp. CU9D]KAF1290776.1 hypothetical protein BAU14_08345 [Enterococcus sp. CU9D]
MKTVLIVDDEEVIRTGLTYIIDWQQYGYERIETAENGVEGLQKISQLQPDLVITDIRMPEMDGLDMIQAAKKQGCLFHGIILSGYSDFDYARKAIQLGFISYLLKPVEEEELMEILEKLAANDKQRHEADLRSLLYNKLFASDHSGLAGYRKILVASFSTALKQRQLDLLNEQQQPYVLLENFGAAYLVLLDKTGIDTSEAVIKTLFGRKEAVMTTGWVAADQDLTKLTMEIQHLRKMQFLFPNQLLSTAGLLEKKQALTFQEELPEKLRQAVLGGKDLQLLLQAYCNNFLFDLAFEEDIKWQVNHDYGWLYDQAMQKAAFEEAAHRPDQVAEALFAAVDFPELMGIFETHLSAFASEVAKQLNNVDIIADIVRYIQKHFADDLNLKSVADQFGYNSAYLGKKFKKTTGETFLGYLEKVRMERAGDLLKNSNLMVYEVAEKVGYRNVDYFYKKFKQFFQTSPNDYRSSS